MENGSMQSNVQGYHYFRIVNEMPEHLRPLPRHALLASITAQKTSNDVILSPHVNGTEAQSVRTIIGFTFDFLELGFFAKLY